MKTSDTFPLIIIGVGAIAAWSLYTSVKKDIGNIPKPVIVNPYIPNPEPWNLVSFPPYEPAVISPFVPLPVINITPDNINRIIDIVKPAVQYTEDKFINYITTPPKQFDITTALWDYNVVINPSAGSNIFKTVQGWFGG